MDRDFPEVTEELLADLNEIRATGAVNMMSMRDVKEVAMLMSLDAADIYFTDLSMLSRNDQAKAWVATLNALGDYVASLRESDEEGC